MKERTTGKEALQKVLECLSESYDKIFILTDSNVANVAGRYIGECRKYAPVSTIIVPCGEASKSMRTAESVLSALSVGGATRSSLLINIGGGMVTDLGGFVASVFKRGIRTINVATSLLAAVDASIGGKTGIDFCGLKNEVGTFHMPQSVIIASDLFESLPDDQIREGYAELIKTLMLCDEGLYRKALDMEAVCGDFSLLDKLAGECASFKKEIVASDPRERGIRRILNLGHTFGHAFESLTGLGHGTAVAHGLLCSLVASRLYSGLLADEVYIYKQFLRENYHALPLGCRDSESILDLVAHDKKIDSHGSVNLVTLNMIGQPAPPLPLTRKDLATVLEMTIG
ncbi:MAG: 3-dehydroquinate synthase [Muribaculum sp.]|nr:3-dehydroquinate synthase [Muribaculum sp.]